jgi:hypothetical protein
MNEQRRSQLAASVWTVATSSNAVTRMDFLIMVRLGAAESEHTLAGNRLHQPSFRIARLPKRQQGPERWIQELPHSSQMTTVAVACFNFPNNRPPQAKTRLEWDTRQDWVQKLRRIRRSTHVRRGGHGGTRQRPRNREEGRVFLLVLSAPACVTHRPS